MKRSLIIRGMDFPFPYAKQDTRGCFSAMLSSDKNNTLCMRTPRHTGGFSADAAYRRRRIGKKLFQAMRQDYAHQVFTVNSLPLQGKAK